MDKKWFTDQSAEAAYKTMKAELGPTLSAMFPGFEFTHFGVNRQEEYPLGPTREVRIVLHMRPIIEARSIDEAREMNYGRKRISE